jgi:hypothetical protein
VPQLEHLPVATWWPDLVLHDQPPLAFVPKLVHLARPHGDTLAGPDEEILSVDAEAHPAFL